MKKSTLLVFAVFLSFTLMGQTTYYVNGVTGNDTNDGINWVTSLATIQAALDKTVSGDKVWVAKGIYIPSKIAGDAPSADNRDKSFSIPNGVSIYGGFVGNEDVNYDLALRNFDANKTTLSGSFDATPANNAYHVVIIASSTANIIQLDGFSITNGNANGTGFFNVHGKPVYRSQSGGINATAGGGDIYITNDLIYNNLATNYGGGILVVANGSNGYLMKNVISGNSTTSHGGGLYAQTFTTTNKLYLVNNVISNNTSTTNGGGIYVNSKFDVYLINNTISYNTAATCGGIYGYTPATTGNIQIINDIVWGNVPAVISGHSSNTGITTVSNTIAEGGYAAGTNIINSDPLFVSISEKNFRLQTGSPAINAGKNSSYISTIFGDKDLDGYNRISQSTIDIGAFEKQITTDIDSQSMNIDNLSYPNPVKNNFYIKGLVGSETINLFDLKGNELTIQKTNSQVSPLYVGSLKSGIYILKITNSESVRSIKLFKE